MTDTTIAGVAGRRVWDSRGRPTGEAEVTLAGGVRGRAVSPAGASRGSREAVDLRDGGCALGGMDVRRALAGLSEVIAPLLLGRDAGDQAACDAAVVAADGTPMLARLGGNAVVAVSLALAHAAAAARGLPLWAHLAEAHGGAPSIPLPEIQIFGGGAHARGRVDVQDFMAMVPGAATFDEALEVTAEIHAAAGSILARRGVLAGVADEGGWWPAFDSNEAALETLMEAIALAGERPGGRVAISLDVAASELGQGGRYRLALEYRELDTGGMFDLLGRWIDAYPIVAVEDPLAEDDREGMRAVAARFGDRVQVIGDDDLVTDADLIAAAAADGACNAALIKVNQAGTLSRAVAAARAAEAAGWARIVSARSGETEDVTIAHLAVGLGAGQLKVGSFRRSERMAKWNEVLRIAEAPASGAFVGAAPLAATAWGRARGRARAPR